MILLDEIQNTLSLDMIKIIIIPSIAIVLFVNQTL